MEMFLIAHRDYDYDELFDENQLVPKAKEE